MKAYRKIMALGLIFLLAGVSACGQKGPKSISLEKNEFMLNGIGATYDIKEDVSADGGDFDALTYKSTDETVAVVSADGIIEARGLGSAQIRVESAANSNVSAAMEIFVYPYCGIYTAEKYIDAMGCDIRIRMSLNEDGTYEYYRYPMNVALSGGGEMPGLDDTGIYTLESSEFTFSGDFLGEFPMNFKVSDGNGFLDGKIPTGGASTQMQLMLNSTDDKGESGTYYGTGEASDGQMLQYELYLNKGEYSLKNSADGSIISEGTYSFENTLIEFSAEFGASFNAEFDSARGVVEGTQIPVGDFYEAAAMTLKRQ